MAGLTTGEAQATLDARFPTSGGGDFIAYSANGTSETASLARTAIGATGWAAATAADPSVKANANVLTSAAATAGVTVSHWCIYSASTAGTQRTDWQTVDAAGTPTPRALLTGDQLQWAVGTAKVTLT